MYTISQRVCASHTDAEGLLKLVSAIDMMQDCSQMWLESEPEVGRFFQKNAIAQMLVSRQIDVLRMPAYGEKLIVETRVYECKNFLGYRNTVIYDDQGNSCVTSWSLGAFVNLATGKPEKLPEAVIAGLCIDPKINMEYLSKRITLPEGIRERLSPVKVSHGDIDFNRHMNNARYVQIALELLPPEFQVSRLRLEYKMPAKYGDTLYPEIIKGEGMYYILLNDNEENSRSYTVMEFSSNLPFQN
jgi:acyl-ACP thioesterase